MKITKELIYHYKPCSRVYQDFNHYFPDGLELTRNNVKHVWEEYSTFYNFLYTDMLDNNARNHHNSSKENPPVAMYEACLIMVTEWQRIIDNAKPIVTTYEVRFSYEDINTKPHGVRSSTYAKDYSCSIEELQKIIEAGDDPTDYRIFGSDGTEYQRHKEFVKSPDTTKLTLVSKEELLLGDCVLAGIDKNDAVTPQKNFDAIVTQENIKEWWEDRTFLVRRLVKGVGETVKFTWTKEK